MVQVTIDNISANLTINDISEIFDYYLCDATAGNININLPEIILYDGIIVSIIKMDVSANTVTLTPFGTEGIINGANPIVITTRYDPLRIISNGGNWLVL